MCYAKVILKAYPQIDSVVKYMDETVKEKCLVSFNDKMPASRSVDDIVKLIENKQKLIVLKEKTRNVLKRLSDEEIAMINYKYFKNRSIGGFDYTSRNYFRRQHKVIEHVKELLGYIDLSEQKFLKEYASIPFIKYVSSSLDDDVVSFY